MALTGFLVNMGGGNPSVCADGAANAILALGARFPYVAGSQPLLCNLESSVFTAPNTFTNTIACHDLTGNQTWTIAHPLTLMQCDPTTYGFVTDGSIFDPVVGAAFWSFAMTFVLGLYLFSRNMGAIISAIRRF